MRALGAPRRRLCQQLDELWHVTYRHELGRVAAIDDLHRFHENELLFDLQLIASDCVFDFVLCGDDTGAVSKAHLLVGDGAHQGAHMIELIERDGLLISVTEAEHMPAPFLRAKGQHTSSGWTGVEKGSEDAPPERTHAQAI